MQPSIQPSIQPSSMTPTSVQKLENSHLIQVTSPWRSVWRGCEHMKLQLSIKVDRRFLKANYTYSYGLVAYLENYKSKEAHYNDMVKDLAINLYVKNDMVLQKCNGDDKDTETDQKNHHDIDSAFVEITHNDIYYELEVTMPKTMFHGGDQIRVIVEAIPLFSGCSIIIYGASQVITFCDLALITMNKFLENEFVTAVDKNSYAWYKNSGSRVSNTLRVVTQIKDASGNPCKCDKLPNMRLKTELVYEDDSPAPLNPISSLHDSKKKKQLTILNMLSDEPILSQTNHPVELIFRIEEVSFHHSGHKGFKLNVCLEEDIPSLNIHQAPMDDLIVVMSKPKRNIKPVSPTPITTPPVGDWINQKRKHESILSNDCFTNSDFIIDADELDMVTGEVRGIIQLEDETYDFTANGTNEERGSSRKDDIAIFPLRALIDSYRCFDACYCCERLISIEAFLQPMNHADCCIFANEVLPLLLMMMGVNQTTSDETQWSILCCPNDTEFSSSPFSSISDSASSSASLNENEIIANKNELSNCQANDNIIKMDPFSSISDYTSSSTSMKKNETLADENEQSVFQDHIKMKREGRVSSVATTTAAKLDFMQTNETWLQSIERKSNHGGTNNNKLTRRGVMGNEKMCSNTFDVINYPVAKNNAPCDEKHDIGKKVRNKEKTECSSFTDTTRTDTIMLTPDSELSRLSPIPFQSNNANGSEIDFNMDMFDFAYGYMERLIN